MFSPIKTMFLHFPLRAYTTVLILLAISWYSYKRIRGSREMGRLTKLQGQSRWLLISYVLLLVFFTVLGRRSLDYYRYNFDIGYSFRDALYNGNSGMIKLIMVNILIFLPVGFLGTLGAKRFGFLKTMVLGLLLTSGIEVAQLVLRNGTCEIDDMISNTIGTFLGAILGIVFLPNISCMKRPAIKFQPHSEETLYRKPAPDDPGWVHFQIERMD